MPICFPLPPPSGPFYQDYYKDDKEGRIALLNCLAAYNTTIAARSKNKQVQVPLLPRGVSLRICTPALKL